MRSEEKYKNYSIFCHFTLCIAAYSPNGGQETHVNCFPVYCKFQSTIYS